jgi:hypothetical protein
VLRTVRSFGKSYLLQSIINTFAASGSHLQKFPRILTSATPETASLIHTHSSQTSASWVSTIVIKNSYRHYNLNNASLFPTSNFLRQSYSGPTQELAAIFGLIARSGLTGEAPIPACHTPNCISYSLPP